MCTPGELPSETCSELSTAPGSSIGSREDIQEIMNLLGIRNPELLVQDRFKIDRKLLENLLFGSDQNAAADLFKQIMNETRTHIAWPSKLKLNAKSKKDPHIRVLGRAEDVALAHDRVLATLGPKGTRVNMKIDVSYTEHSHIIGKGGLTIRKVMEDTACHIHFPDSNRNNSIEKSNQVSIAGDVANVEKARAKVRLLTPLMFCFELPILEAISLTQNTCDPYVQNIQDLYNVQVKYRTRQKLNSTLVVVKGNEWDVANLTEATQLLMNNMCKMHMDRVEAQMYLEISPQHHGVVMGKNNENLKAIMWNTKTQITFMDHLDPNIPSLKKSNVTITGSIHNVYAARQQLIGSLPVVFMFDVPETSSVVNSRKINDVMNAQNVAITTRYKAKQNMITIIIKGIEREIGNVYEAHRSLLGLNDPEIKVEIPDSYFLKDISLNCNKPNWSTNSGRMFQTHPSPPLNHMATNRFSPNPALWHYMLPQLLPIPPNFSPVTHVACEKRPYSVTSMHEHPDFLYYNGERDLTVRATSTPSYGSKLTKTDGGAIPKENDSKSSNPEPSSKRAKMVSPTKLNWFKHQAAQAMRELPDASSCRVPTSSWSGLGLSVSSPDTQKTDYEKMRAAFDGSNDTLVQYENGYDCFTVSAAEFIGEKEMAKIMKMPMTDLTSILINVGLEHYARIFEEHEIDLMSFSMLNELDLQELGITKIGARRKLLLCVSELKRRQKRFTKTPGAQRN